MMLRRFRYRHVTAHARHAHTHAPKLTIGIRKEDAERIWERRCPLTPDAVHDLVHNQGVDVLVQPCERRVWRTGELLEVRVHDIITDRS